MSSYKYETENLEFSWGNDGSVLFRTKGKNILERGVSIKNVEDLELYCFEGESIALRIPDFVKQDQSLAQKIITLFVPIVKNHLRNEIVEGLRYYKVAEHYKLMVPQDIAIVKLNALRKDYDNIIGKYPIYLEELECMEDRARINHINDPLVATTGLMVYATLNATWFIWETLDKAESTPEYLNRVDLYTDNYSYNVETNTQNECIKYVMNAQESLYNMSLATLVKKRNDAETLLKNINDLEIVLKIPAPERWEERNRKIEQPINVDAALNAYNQDLSADIDKI